MISTISALISIFSMKRLNDRLIPVMDNSVLGKDKGLEGAIGITF